MSDFKRSNKVELLGLLFVLALLFVPLPYIMFQMSYNRYGVIKYDMYNNLIHELNDQKLSDVVKSKSEAYFTLENGDVVRVLYDKYTEDLTLLINDRLMWEPPFKNFEEDLGL